MSSAEPADFPYAGWIPSVNGRLSFRHIGESRHPNEAVYANVTTNEARYILAFQQRRLSDQLFQFITHFIFGIEDRFWFVVTAQTTGPAERAEEIIGTVHFYKSKADWRRKARDIISDQISTLNDARLAIDDVRDDKITTAFDEAVTHLQKTSDFEIDFVLWRTGEIFFSNPTFMDDALEDASVEYAESLKQDFLKWVADQAYFFIRDISHRHQHHSSDSDTILILQAHTDDVKWRENVIYSLHHYIIRAKRFADTRSLYQCIGILGYANSFRRTCDRFLEGRADQIPPFNEEELLQSLNARAGEQVQRTAEWGIAATLRLAKRAVGIAILAVLIAVVIMFVQPKIEKGEIPELVAISEFLGKHFQAVVWLLIISFLLMWICSTNWFVRRRLFRDILEASNVGRTGAIYLFVSLSIAVGALSYWWGYAAVSDLARAIQDLFGLNF